MQILTEQKNIGTKAENIMYLSGKGYTIPRTYIFDISNISEAKQYVIQDTETKYILRPSFIGEDGKHSSMAGRFTSIGPINFGELLDFSQKDEENILENFSHNNFSLGTIIIQEFIEAEYYGVYFTRNPENLLLKGNYQVGFKHDDITSGKCTNSLKLPTFLERQLKNVAKRIERNFGFPQDFEFAIQKGKIILLQSRNITSGNIFHEDFGVMQNISGNYTNINNGEFGDIKYFSASLLQGVYKPLHIGGSLYGKYIYFSKNIPQELYIFTKLYRKYLQEKILYTFVAKFLFFQKLDKKILKQFYTKYSYSFDIFTPSLLQHKYNYKSNLKTRILLKSEQNKNKAFRELENIKKNILEQNILGNDIRYLTYTKWLSREKECVSRQRKINQQYLYEKPSITLLHGKILGTEAKKEDILWIYKGEIKGLKVSKNNFNKDTPGQVLLIENLGENLTPYLDYIDGLIAQEGSIYSHNAILLREYKIPSYIA